MATLHHSIKRQDGYAVLSFVIIAMLVAITFILAYAGLMSRHAENNLDSTELKYLNNVRDAADAFYRNNPALMSSTSYSPASSELLAKDIGIEIKHGASFYISNPIRNGDVTYRNILIRISNDNEDLHQFDEGIFQSTGVYQISDQCKQSLNGCKRENAIVINGLSIEEERIRYTQELLEKIALKAQSYFNARNQLDPEKNVSINYFRNPSGNCQVEAMDLECLNTYTGLGSINNGVVNYRVTAINLGLSSHEIFDPWGGVLFASNLEDSVTNDSPFTMSFMFITPYGKKIKIKAVQQF